MSLLGLLAASGSEEPLYSDSVFASHTYTGNGSTQTINNGIDLAGKGGLVWIKDRGISANHVLTDSIRGVSKQLNSNATNSEYNDVGYGVTTFNSNGFIVTDTTGHLVNTNNNNYVSWTFRKAPKFFDVVTATAVGSTVTFNHSLGVAPGIVLIKATNLTEQWTVYHRSLGTGKYLTLNTTAAE